MQTIQLKADYKQDLYFYERQKEFHQIRADIKNGDMEMLSEEQYEQEIEQFFKSIENQS